MRRAGLPLAVPEAAAAAVGGGPAAEVAHAKGRKFRPIGAAGAPQSSAGDHSASSPCCCYTFWGPTSTSFSCLSICLLYTKLPKRCWWGGGGVVDGG